MVEAEVIEAETAEAGADIKEGKHYPDLTGKSNSVLN